jgi:hypothetical protein
MNHGLFFFNTPGYLMLTNNELPSANYTTIDEINAGRNNSKLPTEEMFKKEKKEFPIKHNNNSNDKIH